MAEALLETTVWKDNVVKNGVYLMEGSKALAFRNFKGETTYFTKPLQIDKRGRTFKKMDKIPFKVEKKIDLIEVAGSKGAVYYINTVEQTCTCPGFQFRGKCKHIESVK
jgi:hypothetical protein